MTRLRLGPVGDHKPVKLTLEIAPTLFDAIVRYSEIHAKLTGRAVPLAPERLIPPIIEHFIASDREFARQRRSS